MYFRAEFETVIPTQRGKSFMSLAWREKQSFNFFVYQYMYMYMYSVSPVSVYVYVSKLMCCLPQQNVSSPHTITATNFFDYTARIQGIWNDVHMQSPSTIDECCDYDYQILDKFCASRETVSRARYVYRCLLTARECHYYLYSLVNVH